MPLSIFESTPLYEHAVRDGHIVENATAEARRVDISYQQAVENLRRDSRHLYLNALLYLMRYRNTRGRAGVIPRFLLDHVMLTRSVVGMAEALDCNDIFRGGLLGLLSVTPTRDRRFFLKQQAKRRIQQIFPVKGVLEHAEV
jgi:hypothetical protein